MKLTEMDPILRQKLIAQHQQEFNGNHLSLKELKKINNGGWREVDFQHFGKCYFCQEGWLKIME